MGVFFRGGRGVEMATRVVCGSMVEPPWSGWLRTMRVPFRRGRLSDPPLPGVGGDDGGGCRPARAFRRMPLLISTRDGGWIVPACGESDELAGRMTSRRRLKPRRAGARAPRSLPAQAVSQAVPAATPAKASDPLTGTRFLTGVVGMRFRHASSLGGGIAWAWVLGPLGHKQRDSEIGSRLCWGERTGGPDLACDRVSIEFVIPGVRWSPPKR